MRADEQIRILGVKTDLSISEIARRLEKSPQAFCQKMKRGTFTVDDLAEIAMVTNCKLECRFVLPNGETIDIE